MMRRMSGLNAKESCGKFGIFLTSWFEKAKPQNYIKIPNCAINLTKSPPSLAEAEKTPKKLLFTTVKMIKPIDVSSA